MDVIFSFFLPGVGYKQEICLEASEDVPSFAVDLHKAYRVSFAVASWEIREDMGATFAEEDVAEDGVDNEDPYWVILGYRHNKVAAVEAHRG
jgi:hypothetical protein